MKVIIAGSRGITSYATVQQAIVTAPFYWQIFEVVSGGADGVDKLGEGWAEAFSIPIKRFRPDWKAHGKAAGPIRNREMATYADAAIICWDGKSRGTASMIDAMRALGKPVHLVRTDFAAPTGFPFDGVGEKQGDSH